MDTSRKMALRVGLWLSILFAVTAFFVGIIDGILLSIAGLAIWKTYSYLKLKRFWDQQTTATKRTIEYASAFINGQSRINNKWIDVLHQPGMSKLATEYQKQLMLDIAVCEKKEDPIESWTEWGGNRIDVHVNGLSDEERRENFADSGFPISLDYLMINRAGFEIIVAEYALSLHGIENPRATIVQRTAAKAFSATNKLFGVETTTPS